MSGINGDKSRFNRERKQKIARRIKTRALLKGHSGQSTMASKAASAAKSKPVSS